MSKGMRLMEEIGLSNFVSAAEVHVSASCGRLLTCPTCSNGKPTQAGLYNNRYLLLQCGNASCPVQWFLCIECQKRQRSHIVNKKQLKNHMSNNHSRKRQAETQAQGRDHPPPVNPAHMEVVEDHMPLSDDCAGENRDTSGEEWCEVVNPQNLGFDDEKSQLYFQQCFLGMSSQAGIAYLVKRGSVRFNHEPQHFASIKLPEHHSELQTRIAHLGFSLTKGETERVIAVLAGAYKVGCEDGFACWRDQVNQQINQTRDTTVKKAMLQLWESHNKFSQNLVKHGAYTHSTKIPTKWNDMRQMHLEGPHSILANLPTPKAYQDVPGHSYVSLIECIRHFLGHRSLSEVALIPECDSQSTTTFHSSESQRAKEIVKQHSHSRNKLHSYLLMWSDDVEPNRTKANRGSVWLFTATIGTTLANGHSMHNTFPIAVGKKGADHDPVIAKVEEQLQFLRSGSCPNFYVGRQRKKVSLTFDLFATLQDQPERRDFNCMRAGNGAHTGRFGVSADHASLYDANVLPACRQCLEHMESGLKNNDCVWPMAPCGTCLRWDALEDNNGLARYKAPTNYPRDSRRVVEEKEDGSLILRPFRITYESLRAGLDTVYDRYVNGNWSLSNCESFLEVEGMSTKFINVVMDHCMRSYSLAAARRVAKEDPNRFRAILEEATRDPPKYAKAPYPSAWTRQNTSLKHHPDVIMHLLFLGVVKTTIGQIQNCLAAQSKLASFLKSTEDYLTEFLAVNIEWMAIQPYQAGKMGGWVSENFLGFSRILPWFFQNINEAVELTVDLSPPEGLPQSKWLHRHNKHWLQVRGLDTKGKKEELQERVAKLLVGGPPDPLPAPDIPPATVEAMLRSLAELLKCIMRTSVTPELVNRTRYAVRVFLSKYDSLCRPIREKKTAVLSSYNFICLLNVPDSMELLGPLRCLWEGGPQGEGFVRFSKPLMTQGLRQNWHYFLMNKMQKAKAFECMIGTDDPAMPGVDDDDALRCRKGSFHKYDSVFSLQQYFRRDRPLKRRKPVFVVLIRTNTGGTRVLAVVTDYHHVLEITMTISDAFHWFGLYYHRVDEPKGEPIEWSSIADTVAKMGFGVLLPRMSTDDHGDHFALISSNWETLRPSIPISSLID